MVIEIEPTSTGPISTAVGGAGVGLMAGAGIGIGVGMSALCPDRGV